MENCGYCKYWDTTGFGDPTKAEVGQCNLVERHWYPMRSDRMISLSGLNNISLRAKDTIGVITRREFGCNQHKQVGK